MTGPVRSQRRQFAEFLRNGTGQPVVMQVENEGDVGEQATEWGLPHARLYQDQRSRLRLQPGAGADRQHSVGAGVPEIVRAHHREMVVGRYFQQDVGRADKGLLITTGNFTRDAEREATRDGAPAIDLIDGEGLADKLKELSLGVETREVTTEKIEIDRDWFLSI